MIISASRRTDIPAFYSKWFINRIRAGYCTVPNPMNIKQVSTVSLKPEDVDVIVFWTRYVRPLIPHLSELDSRGFRYYFQYTVLGYPRPWDTKTPTLEASLDSFRRLSERIGPEKTIWRYDPIIFSNITDSQFHLINFQKIAQTLKGFTSRCVVSIADINNYNQARNRINLLKSKGVNVIEEPDPSLLTNLLPNIVKIAHENGIEILSCAEDLIQYGIKPGKCVDGDLIVKLFPELEDTLNCKKDSSQRKLCGCAVSKDIGIYNTCQFGCQYCYATQSFQLALKNYRNHDATYPSLLK
jgi:hypothetical protein